MYLSLNHSSSTPILSLPHLCTQALLIPVLFVGPRSGISSGPITNTAHTVVGYVGLHYTMHMCIQALMLVLTLILTIKPGSNISSSLITNIVHAVVG